MKASGKSSFEWMELQTLTNDIELSRSRLIEARSRRNPGRVRALEQEITRAEKTRLTLLTHISTTIATAAEPASKANEGAEEQPLIEPVSALEPALSPKAKERAGSRQASAPAAKALQDQAKGETPLPGPVSALEPAPPPKAKDRAGSLQASAAAAKALQDQAKGERPLPDRVDRIAASGSTSPASARKTDSAEGGIIVWDQLTPSDIERAIKVLSVRRAKMLAKHAEELNRLDADQLQLETLEQAIDAFVRKLNWSSSGGAIVTLGEEPQLRQQGRR